MKHDPHQLHLLWSEARRLAGAVGGIVAGGFLRDTTLGFEPKDVDVFIPHNAASTGMMEEYLTNVIGAPVKAELWSLYQDGEVHRVYAADLKVDGKYPVQIIELAEGLDVRNRAEHHDFGLCQIWLDESGWVYPTEHFMRDWKDSTCTLVHCETHAEHARSMRRWKRLSKKLVGYTLVDNTALGTAEF